MTFEERGYLTPDMLRALRYLDDKMHATSAAIAGALFPDAKRELAAMGAAIAGHLKRQGCVTFLSDVRAWRITPAGREALKTKFTS